MNIRLPTVSVLVFFGAALAVCTVALGITHTVRFAERPDALSLAITADVAVVIPILFYGLLIRRRAAPWFAFWPVVVASWLTARAILPEGHRQYVHALGTLAPLAEAVLTVWLVIRIRRIVRGAREAARRGVDALGCMQAGLARALGDNRVARLIADELAAWHYAVLARRPAPTPAGAAAFSYHRTSGWGAILFAISLATMAEAIAVHVLITQWSGTAAWIVTILTLYGLLWLFADWRAMRLRPITLDDDTLHVRMGLRWTVDVPLDVIAAVTDRPRPAPARRERGYLRATPMGDPDLLVELATPIIAQGPYGICKAARRIGIRIDERGDLVERLRERLGSPAPRETPAASSRDAAPVPPCA